MRRLASPAAFVLLAHCASASVPTQGSTTPVATAPEPDEPDAPEMAPSTFDPKSFVAAYARPRVAMLAGTNDSGSELDHRVANTRDPAARRTLARASVIAHLAAALEARDSATREPHRRAMLRASRIAAHGAHDARALAELAFAEVYLAYMSDAADGWRKADAFFMNHVVDRELLRIDTMIRGELMLERGDDARARAIFALLRGDRDDPLTSYAIYRSAATYCRRNQAESCRLLLDEVRRRGCDPDATPEALDFGHRAFVELGIPAVPRRERDRSMPRFCSRQDVATFSDPLFGP